MAVENLNRFKKLVHYVCSQCADDPTKLGAVKLNKALWLADLRAFYKFGQPITPVRYVKREFGPVPSPILPVLRELEADGALSIHTVDHHGKPKREFIVHRLASSDFLNADEKLIVDEAVTFVTERHTAASISEYSHDHIWTAAEDGEEIPHYTVFANPADVTDEDREWAQLKLEGGI
jgi:Antitoxin SocA-like, Panacea domain